MNSADAAIQVTAAQGIKRLCTERQRHRGDIAAALRDIPQDDNAKWASMLEIARNA